MKEPHVEGVATHDVPESCGGVREDVAEALTGARSGRVSSCEINTHPGADDVQRVGRQHGGHRNREVALGWAQSKTPSTYGTFLRENREIPSSPAVWHREPHREGKTVIR